MCLYSKSNSANVIKDLEMGSYKGLRPSVMTIEGRWGGEGQGEGRSAAGVGVRYSEEEGAIRQG